MAKRSTRTELTDRNRFLVMVMYAAIPLQKFGRVPERALVIQEAVTAIRLCFCHLHGGCIRDGSRTPRAGRSSGDSAMKCFLDYPLCILIVYLVKYFPMKMRECLHGELTSIVMLIRGTFLHGFNLATNGHE